MSLSLDFDAAMQSLESLPEAPTIAVAVSGGADSLALTLFLQKWISKKSGKLVALTVDHGLRSDAAEEAQQVKTWMQDLGVAHHTLTWSGDIPKSKIQEEARSIRYQLLLSYCRENNIPYLALAHHQEDQAETFLLRLIHQSGTDGLACMRPKVEREGVILLRPLLGVSKKQLITFLEEKKQPWIEDPSNQNDMYERVRLRKTFEDFAQVGLTARALSNAVGHLQKSRDALEFYTKQHIKHSGARHPLGFFSLNQRTFFSAPEDILYRALTWILREVSGNQIGYSPRRESLEILIAKMQDPNFQGTTLFGCEVFPYQGDLIIARERHALPNPVPVESDQKLLWDQRFTLEWKNLPQNIYLSPLGEKKFKIPEEKNIPHQVRQGLPAFFSGDKEVLAVPSLKCYKESGIICPENIVKWDI